MTKILFVGLHRPFRSASQRFRFEMYMDYFQANGFQIEHLHLIDEKDDRIFYRAGNYFGKLKILLKSIIKLWKYSSQKKYDIVFVQREAFMLGTAFFEKRFAQHSKLIFDFDDAIWKMNVSEGNKSLAFLKNPSKTAEIIQIADMVFAGNQFLANYALQFNSNVKVVPTAVDLEEYQKIPCTNKNAVRIGWIGSPTTIPYLQIVIPAFRILKQKYGNQIEFRIVGDPHFRVENLEIQAIPWKKEEEVKELSCFDIGIMPLTDDEWSKGKCGFKGLQYMAFEVPAIMSPVGVNLEIIQEGVNGFLAQNTEEWIQKISLLVDNPELRKTLGLAGRKTVEKKYSKQVWQNKIIEYFHEVLKNKP